MYRVVGKFIASAALAAAILAPGLASAATQGSTGATTQGTVVINASVPNLVKLSGLADMAISVTGALNSANQSVCAYSNTGNYTVTATAVGGTFSLTGTSASITYSVQWASTAGATSGTGLTYGVASAGFATGGANPACGGGLNASLIVNIADTDVGTAPADTYTGTLELSIAPN